jgi:hypothetical protein
MGRYLLKDTVSVDKDHKENDTCVFVSSNTAVMRRHVLTMSVYVLPPLIELLIGRAMLSSGLAVVSQVSRLFQAGNVVLGAVLGTVECVRVHHKMTPQRSDVAASPAAVSVRDGFAIGVDLLVVTVLTRNMLTSGSLSIASPWLISRHLVSAISYVFLTDRVVRTVVDVVVGSVGDWFVPGGEMNDDWKGYF